MVYRCFIEQSAIDGTIETREWTEDIYNFLDDFELSIKSKKQIEESVKYEVNMAGTEYLINKYAKEDLDLSATDFLFNIEESSNQKNNKHAIYDNMLDLDKINNILTDLEEEFLSKNSFSFLYISSLSKNDLSEEIVKENIRLPILIESIEKSFKHGNGFVKAFRFCEKKNLYDFSEKINEIIKEKEKEEKEQKEEIEEIEEIAKDYFFIATIDGLFFFIDDKIAFVEYDSIISINKFPYNFFENCISILADKVDWYTENGDCIPGENEIEIADIYVSEDYFATLRKGIENIIDLLGVYVESKFDKIERIVGKYIKYITTSSFSEYITTSSSSNVYLVNEFHYGDYEKNNNRLMKALSKYALKVRKDEVIGFIDTSILNNGGDGLLFSKYGIAFDCAFEKIFIRYDEIRSMSIKKAFLFGKELVFYGHFSERKDNSTNPSIQDINFNLYRLKDCLKEIMYIL